MRPGGTSFWSVVKGDQPMPHPVDALPADVVVHRDLAYVSRGHLRQVLEMEYDNEH